MLSLDSFSSSWFDLSHKIDDARMLGKAESLARHLLNQLLAQGDSGVDDPVVPPWKKQLGKEATG
jgi:hypothetical protein